MQSTYFYLALIVFALNIAPAFAPPTWTVLVLFKLNSNIPSLPLILIGAIFAGLGRYSLALLTSKLRNHISEKQNNNLAAVSEYLNRNKAKRLLGLVFFVISPLPSAQLFEAVGLMGLRLIPFTVAFFLGRIVSYSIYVTGISAIKEKGLSDIILNNLKSPIGIGLQLLLLAGIYLLTRVEWSTLQKPKNEFPRS